MACYSLEKPPPHSLLLLPLLSFVGIFFWCVSQWHQFNYKAVNSWWALKSQHSSCRKRYIIFSILCSQLAGGMKIVIKRIAFFFIELSAVKEAVIFLAAAAACSLCFLNCLVISGCSVIMIAMRDNDTKLMVDAIEIHIKTETEKKCYDSSWPAVIIVRVSVAYCFPRPTSETPR